MLQLSFLNGSTPAPTPLNARGFLRRRGAPRRFKRWVSLSFMAAGLFMLAGSTGLAQEAKIRAAYSAISGSMAWVKPMSADDRISALVCVPLELNTPG